MKLGSIEEEAAACREAFRDSEIGDMVWHVHHEKLSEPLGEPAENRISYIIRSKPKEEQALRLRLFRPVKSAAVASAQKTYYAAVAPARKTYYDAVASAWKTYDAAAASAWKTYYAAVAPAQKTYYAAVAPAQKTYYDAAASAHPKECPGCPWGGSTIFP